MADCKLAKLPDLQVTMRGDRALVHVKIEGVDGLFMVDTGAFFSSATAASVARFKLLESPAPFGMYVTGIGHGETGISVATVKAFVFDGVPLHRIDFIVLDRRLGEDLDGSIGENILGAPDVEYDLGDGAIRLFQATGCRNNDLAYWVTSAQPYSVIDNDVDGKLEPPRAIATINGFRIHVIFDTGSPRSLLSTEAAAKAGVKPSDPGVVMTGYTGGIAAHSQLNTWRGRFASFKLGDEEIRNTPLQFGEIGLQGADMILGADFFLSHRVFVANSQHKIYFTYNGGKVFDLDAGPSRRLDMPAPDAAAAPAASAPPPGAQSAAVSSDTPQDASGYARQGEAYASRRDYPDAISDLTRAISLAPDNADYVFQRGQAELASRQPLLGMADLDQALKLRPDDIRTLVERAMVRWRMGQPLKARADLDAAAGFADKQPAARLGIAQAYSVMHLYKEALTQLDQWIADNPHDERFSGGLNERCWARAQLGVELDKALADCNAALKLNPGDPTILDSRGLVSFRMGGFDKSISDYDAALRLRPNEPWSLYGRGLDKLGKGLTAEGQADIRAALSLDPRLADEAKAAGLPPPPQPLDHDQTKSDQPKL